MNRTSVTAWVLLLSIPASWESRARGRRHLLVSHSLPQSVIFLRLLFFTNERQALLRAEDEYLHG